MYQTRCGKDQWPTSKIQQPKPYFRCTPWVRNNTTKTLGYPLDETWMKRKKKNYNKDAI